MAFSQLVTFEIAGNEYAVDINAISSIVKKRDYSFHKLPNTTSQVEGAINLRGKVCLVFNLASRFQLTSEADENQRKILVIQNGKDMIGFVVDEVTDIYKLHEDEIEAMPGTASALDKGLILGIAKVEGKLILILDLLRVIGSDEQIDLDGILSARA